MRRLRIESVSTKNQQKGRDQLRVVLPELEAMGDRLASVGLDATYIARGREILTRLAADKARPRRHNRSARA